MPRSFLVKTHSSHRVPNYGQLETQRGRGCALPCPAQGSTPAGQEGRRLPPHPLGAGTPASGGRRDHGDEGRKVSRGRLMHFRNLGLGQAEWVRILCPLI